MSPHAGEINNALEAGISQAEISRLYYLSHDSISRHAREHLRRAIKASTPLTRAEQIQRWLDRCEFAFEAASKRKDIARQLSAIQTALQVLKTDMQRCGELRGDQTNIQVNIAQQPREQLSDAEVVAEMKDLLQVLESAPAAALPAPRDAGLDVQPDVTHAPEPEVING